MGDRLFSQTKKRSGQPRCSIDFLDLRNATNFLATISGESTATPISEFNALTAWVFKAVFVALGAKYRTRIFVSPSSLASACENPLKANLVAEYDEKPG